MMNSFNVTTAINSITLRQLKLFVNLAKNCNVTQTARKLHLSQSAITQQLLLLESYIGRRLFQRLPRGMELTEDGKALLPFARRIIDSLQDFGDRVEELQQPDPGELSGHIRIAAVYSGMYFVPRVVSEFLNLHPKVDPQLMFANRDTVFEQLIQKEVDVAICGRAPRIKVKTRTTPFAVNHLSLLAPPNWLDSRKQPGIQRLQDETWLIREKGSGTRAAVEEYWQKTGIKPKSIIETNNNESIKQSVMANLGITIISLSSVHNELRQGLLIAPSARYLPIKRKWFVITLEHRYQNPSVSEFESFIVDNGAALILE